MQYYSKNSNARLNAPLNVLSDRRQYQKPILDDLWNRLTLAQQFSVANLGQFGYNLSFIRRVAHNSLAILHLKNKTATISSDGTINISSGIELRH